MGHFVEERNFVQKVAMCPLSVFKRTWFYPFIRFDFLQLHWHWGANSSRGSEHTLNGKEYPLEVHLVHVNTKYYVNGAPSADNFAMPDGLAVLGIFYEISTEDNANLTTILDKVMTHSVWSRSEKHVQGERGCRGGGTKAQSWSSWTCWPRHEPLPSVIFTRRHHPVLLLSGLNL